MSEENEKVAENALGCVLILIMIPISILLKGFVLSKLWFWFMVPLGVVPISLAHAYGLAILIALFTHQSQKPAEEGTLGQMAFRMFIMSIGGPLIVWFVGWLCYCAM